MQGRCFAKQVEGLFAQWYAMLHACLHPLRRFPPFQVLEVDLVPGCAPGFTGACRRENQKSEAQPGGY